jgi:hypothetical protein
MKHRLKFNINIKFSLSFLIIAGIFITVCSAAPVVSRPALITSVPSGAQISLDGVVIGTTPHEISRLSEGNHKLILSKEGFVSKEFMYNNLTHLNDDLGINAIFTTSKTAFIGIDTFPLGADVYLDNILKGTTSTNYTKIDNRQTNLLINDISYGNHKLRIIHPNFPEKNLEISLEYPEGRTTFVDLTDTYLSPNSSLGIESTPRGGSVYLDGVYRGVTPLYLIKNVIPGEHILDVKLEGYTSFSSKILSKSGNITSANIFLAPITNATEADSSILITPISLVIIGFLLNIKNRKE